MRNAVIVAVVVIVALVAINKAKVSSAPAVDTMNAVAYVAGDFAMFEHSAVPKPHGPKVGDVCPVCNGSGKVGDGKIETACGTCGGDGKIDEADLKKNLVDEPFIGITLDPPVVAEKPVPAPQEPPKVEPEAPKAEQKIRVSVFVSATCAPCTAQWTELGGDPAHNTPVEYGQFHFTPYFNAPSWVQQTPTSYFPKNGKWYKIVGWPGLKGWMEAYENADRPVAAPASPPAQQSGWHWPDGSPADPPGASNNYYNGACPSCRKGRHG